MSNISNYDKKSQIIRMHHMFQKRNQGANSEFDLESLPQHQHNLSKIVKRYQTQQDQDVEIKTNSLVSNVKNLIESQNKDVTKPLYDYLESLKEQLFKNEEEFVETQNIEEEVINEIEMEENETIENEEEKIDIESLLKTTEKEIINTRDQKTLLKNLIDDVKLNSNQKTHYDESQFERNMTDIINETKEDENQQEKVEEKPIKKKRHFLTWAFLIIVLVILGGVAYLYKDIIIDYYDQLLNQLFVQPTIHLEEVS